MSSHKSRAVIVAGVRTPFLRSFGAFTRLDTIKLGVAAVQGLLQRQPLEWSELDSLVWGGVVLPSASANIGREIAIDAGLPPSVEAATVTRACTSSLYSVTTAAALIERGEAEVVIAGGGDSCSNAELNMPQSLVHKAGPVFMSRRSGMLDYLKLLTRLHPTRDLLPRQPSVRERSTGELMGESAEKMAQRHGISREAQDTLALQSHQRAAAAIESGRFAGEIVPVDPREGERIEADDLVRPGTSLEKLARLRAAFAKDGTLTAGNSSALTDGAAAVLLMSEARARALGHTELVAFRSWSYDGVDPADQLLIGPAISMPRALQRAGMALQDVDLVDIHEAFAAQVLCVLEMLANDRFAQDQVGLDKAVGRLAPEDINLHGGSIALGHPFAATGARMITTMSNQLKQSGQATALLGICAAGGLSGAAVLERID